MKQPGSAGKDSGHRTERRLRRAIETRPSDARAWSDLGAFLTAAGRLPEAERALGSAIAAAPHDPVRVLQFASLVLMAGRLADADRLMGRAEALARSPRADAKTEDVSVFDQLRAELYGQMGELYARSGQIRPALGCLEQAVVLGAGRAVQERFIVLLLGVDIKSPRPALKPILQRALEESWADAIQVGRLCANQLVLDADFRAFGVELSAEGAPDFGSPSSRSILSEPLLLSLLTRALVVDPTLEHFLTAARRAALRLASDPTALPESGPTGLEPFLAALAQQGFISEYAQAVSPDEDAAFAILLDRCRSDLARGERPSPREIVVIASYDGLHKVFDPHRLLGFDWPAWLDPVIAQQVRDPLREADLKREISTLTAIRDPGSLSVQAQYEDNPFPRWTTAPPRNGGRSLSTWVKRTFPAASDVTVPARSGRHQVLVAGCGTGQETAALSLMFSDIDLLAIDLSRASLAHALRKSQDLNLENVAFVQADLLEARSLGRKFDLVVSAGVLHHLDDPVQGLKALRDVARPKGLMLIALYSGVARRHLIAARAFAELGEYGVSSVELRRYRADVLNLPDSPIFEWRNDLLNRTDFYSLSMLRDLIFHVRETCFDISRIDSTLEDLNLRFCGFSTTHQITQAFMKRFGPEADATSLAQWRIFEEENPETFWHMYHFLAERN